MYESDPIYHAFRAEREREVADLLREREYRRATQPEPPEASGSMPSFSGVPVWWRLARALHLPLPKAAPRSV
jgi:hypothetical protein